MFSPSIVAHAEEEQNISATQAVNSAGEDTNDSDTVSENEEADTPACVAEIFCSSSACATIDGLNIIAPAKRIDNITVEGINE